MALRVKPYFFPALWMTMAGFTLLTAGDRSRLGEESRDDGLEDNEWGDMGLASGEAPWWSKVGHNASVTFPYRHGDTQRDRLAHPPEGIIRDRVVADADLMTLFSGLELGAGACLSASPESSRWRALRAARSLMALGVDGESLSAAPLAAPPVLLLLLLLPLARSHTSPELPAAETSQMKGNEREESVRTFRARCCVRTDV